MVAARKVKQDTVAKAQASIHWSRVIHSLPPQAFAADGFGGNSSRMDSVRIARALARIEAASKRIEAAASQRAQTDPRLQARYDRLRREAEGALAEVDSLIATLSS